MKQKSLKEILETNSTEFTVNRALTGAGLRLSVTRSGGWGEIGGGRVPKACVMDGDRTIFGGENLRQVKIWLLGYLAGAAEKT